METKLNWQELKECNNPIAFFVSGFGGRSDCVTPVLHQKLKLQGISSRTKENETVLNCATQGRAIAKLRQAIALDLASSRLNNQSLGESFLSNNNLILDEQPNERPKIQKAKALHDSGLSESRFSESLSVFI